MLSPAANGPRILTGTVYLMKKALIFLLLLFLPLAGLAEVFEIEDESGLPADWHFKPTLRLTMLDTDRSDAMLLECGGEAMLLDSGSGQYRERLYELLEKRNISYLKYLFSSHSDNDHVHGFVYLMNSGNYEVGAFLTPNRETYRDDAGYHQKAVRAAKRAEIPYVIIGEGDLLTLGGATIDVLRCNEEWGQNARGASCLIQFGNARVLAVGDIDNRTMDWYATHYDASQLDCDILKIPHHGLATVPDNFHEATSPQLLLVPNTYKRLWDGKRTFVNWTRTRYTGLTRYSGDGTVVCVTDGQDWYIWQEDNWRKSK